ncbi:hypothetical protein ACIOHS_27155 [Streptomyces sp. NPDC088253]|uniref:hypothetical protein n=1 Tax=Streptomyces sp. NPDC088253 TaxID=3365846 RepID=UPI00382574A1
MTAENHAQMTEVFAALAIDTDATYLCVITEGESAALSCQDRMSGIRVRNLIQAQTRLADSIEQDPAGRITVRLADRNPARSRVCTYMRIVAEDRDFIMVGQCQGGGYTLWDIAPAPVDLSRRQVVVEELDVEAADAFGTVNIVSGTTAREAVNSFLMGMRQQSGLDDYDLTADSRTENLEALEKTERPADAEPPVEAQASAEDVKANAEVLGLVACVVRSAYPAAMAVSVHAPDREIVAILDGSTALWDLTGPVLPPAMQTVRAWLVALLAHFDEEELTGLGWTRDAQRDHVYTSALPVRGDGGQGAAS